MIDKEKKEQKDEKLRKRGIFTVSLDWGKKYHSVKEGEGNICNLSPILAEGGDRGVHGNLPRGKILQALAFKSHASPLKHLGVGATCPCPLLHAPRLGGGN